MCHTKLHTLQCRVPSADSNVPNGAAAEEGGAAACIDDRTSCAGRPCSSDGSGSGNSSSEATGGPCKSGRIPADVAAGAALSSLHVVLNLECGPANTTRVNSTAGPIF